MPRKSSATWQHPAFVSAGGSTSRSRPRRGVRTVGEPRRAGPRHPGGQLVDGRPAAVDGPGGRGAVQRSDGGDVVGREREPGGQVVDGLGRQVGERPGPGMPGLGTAGLARGAARRPGGRPTTADCATARRRRARSVHRAEATHRSDSIVVHVATCRLAGRRRTLGPRTLARCSPAAASAAETLTGAAPAHSSATTASAPRLPAPQTPTTSTRPPPNAAASVPRSAAAIPAGGGSASASRIGSSGRAGRGSTGCRAAARRPRRPAAAPGRPADRHARLRPDRSTAPGRTGRRPRRPAGRARRRSPADGSPALAQVPSPRTSPGGGVEGAEGGIERRGGGEQHQVDVESSRPADRSRANGRRTPASSAWRCSRVNRSCSPSSGARPAPQPDSRGDVRRGGQRRGVLSVTRRCPRASGPDPPRHGLGRAPCSAAPAGSASRGGRGRPAAPRRAGHHVTSSHSPVAPPGTGHASSRPARRRSSQRWPRGIADAQPVAGVDQHLEVTEPAQRRQAASASWPHSSTAEAPERGADGRPQLPFEAGGVEPGQPAPGCERLRERRQHRVLAHDAVRRAGPARRPAPRPTPTRSAAGPAPPRTAGRRRPRSPPARRATPAGDVELDERAAPPLLHDLRRRRQPSEHGLDVSDVQASGQGDGGAGRRRASPTSLRRVQDLAGDGGRERRDGHDRWRPGSPAQVRDSRPGPAGRARGTASAGTTRGARRPSVARSASLGAGRRRRRTGLRTAAAVGCADVGRPSGGEPKDEVERRGVGQPVPGGGHDRAQQDEQVDRTPLVRRAVLADGGRVSTAPAMSPTAVGESRGAPGAGSSARSAIVATHAASRAGLHDRTTAASRPDRDHAASAAANVMRCRIAAAHRRCRLQVTACGLGGRRRRIGRAPSGRPTGRLRGSHRGRRGCSPGSADRPDRSRA